MTKRPKSVEILGKRIRITYLADNPHSDIAGLFDPNKLEIRILDTVYWDSSLLHEIIHAALFVSGASTLVKHKEEEAIVTALEHALFGLYKRDF